MTAKIKNLIFMFFVLGLFLVSTSGCTTTNPPVDSRTGATTITPKK